MCIVLHTYNSQWLIRPTHFGLIMQHVVHIFNRTINCVNFINFCSVSTIIIITACAWLEVFCLTVTNIAQYLLGSYNDLQVVCIIIVYRKTFFPSLARVLIVPSLLGFDERKAKRSTAGSYEKCSVSGMLKPIFFL